MKQANTVYVATTDDVADSLEYHQLLKNDDTLSAKGNALLSYRQFAVNTAGGISLLHKQTIGSLRIGDHRSLLH